MTGQGQRIEERLDHQRGPVQRGARQRRAGGEDGRMQQGPRSRRTLCDTVASQMRFRRGSSSQGSRAKSWKLPASVRTFRASSSPALAATRSQARAAGSKSTR